MCRGIAIWGVRLGAHASVVMPSCGALEGGVQPHSGKQINYPYQDAEPEEGAELEQGFG